VFLFDFVTKCYKREFALSYWCNKEPFSWYSHNNIIIGLQKYNTELNMLK